VGRRASEWGSLITLIRSLLTLMRSLLTLIGSLLTLGAFKCAIGRGQMFFLSRCTAKDPDITSCSC
jgi:hypothetical protein